MCLNKQLKYVDKIDIADVLPMRLCVIVPYYWAFFKVRVWFIGKQSRIVMKTIMSLLWLVEMYVPVEWISTPFHETFWCDKWDLCEGTVILILLRKGFNYFNFYSIDR